MKKYYFILLFLIPIVGFSQMRGRLNSTDLERYQLTGQVKKVTHTEYQPRFSNDTTYTLELYDFFGLQNYELDFHQNGYLETKTELGTENDSLKAIAVWEYKYDAKNRIIQEKNISFKHSKDTVIWNYQYEGDSVTYIQQLDKTFQILYYTYIQNGELEYLNTANSDSSYLTKYLYKYDKQNRLIRFENYTNKEFVQDLKIYTFKDTISRNKFKEISISARNNRSSYSEFEYDERGNVTTVIIGDFVSSEPAINKYTYVYDERGNWIEKTHIGWRGKLSTVNRREIEYYE